MKLSVSAFRGAQASAHKKILNSSSSYHFGATPKFTSPPPSTASFSPLQVEDNQMMVDKTGVGPGGGSDPPVKSETSSNTGSHESQPPPSSQPEIRINVPTKNIKSEDVRVTSSEKSQRTRSNQRWMKLRTTVQLSGAITTMQKPKPQLKREDSFLKRFSTRQIPETQETLDTGDDGDDGSSSQGEPEGLRRLRRRKRRHRKKQPSSVVNPDENFYYYWLFLVSVCVLYNLWTLIVRQSFPEFQELAVTFWFLCDNLTDLVFILDIVVQFRTGYLEQGLMVYDSKKLALHYVKSRPFVFDLVAMIPLQLLQLKIGTNPLLRFPRFVKVYRVYDYYYMVESRTVYPNLWRVVNLIHILLILAHWFGCFYYLLSEAEGFKGDWVYPYRPGDYATLTRKYLGSLYWSTLTLTTIGDLPTPETNADHNVTYRLPHQRKGRYKKSRLLQFNSNMGFVFTIVSYLIGVFIFATIVGQVGNVITNRNANRLEFERLLDGAKTYMRHHKVPSGMKRRVLRWYDYSWSRGRIQGGGDINTALGLLPDKLKTELALHVNLSVLKKVTIFQECQPEFLHDLVLKMKAFIFTPGDLICRKGEVAREMFIIADGILEVISETGHVLTTMMAGDFFGEIGILNLDGLNKRTADVRSVGYSELFSLSREDVLAAMKDYPEAQEILQTLGRKRLMEAKSITKAYNEQRKQAELNAMVINAAAAAEHRAKNKIVDRICSDVKGLKSVLRKSRRGTNSEDSLELQPLTSISGKTDNQMLVGNKGMLCRMQKVLSEDTYQDDDHNGPAERRISAGFPLLNKLKTLTDKHHQHHHTAPATHPDTAEQPDPPKEEPEIEPIGVGLPLIQRLLLLKQREDQEGKTTTVTTTTVRTQQSSFVTTQCNKKPKVVKKEVAFAEDLVPKEDDKIVQQSRHEKKAEFMKPWCLLRKATINQNCKNIHRPNKTFKYEQFRYQMEKNDDDGKPSSSKDTSSSAAAASSTTTTTKNTHRCLTRLYGSGIKNAQSCLAQSSQTCDNMLINLTICDNTNNVNVVTSSNNNSGDRDGNTDSNHSNNNLNSSSSESESKRKSCSQNQLVATTSAINICSTTETGGSDTRTRVYLPMSARSSKTYQSVDDLSPEYSGLPFVKKLKILNERQKLAELEENVFIRSCSLDLNKAARRGVHAKSSFSNLTRSLSETTAMEVVLRSRRYQQQSRSKKDNPNTCSLPATFSELDLPSPEGCETLERRKLKSILKKISSGNCKISDILRHPELKDSNPDNVALSELELIKKLMNAQTVQGYVARHSTLEKSMTCNSSLRSPPSAARTVKSNDSTAFTFDDTSSLIPISVSSPDTDTKQAQNSNEIKYLERDNSHSPSKNPDLIPDVYVLDENLMSPVQLPAFVSEHLSASTSSDGDGYSRFQCTSYNRDLVEGLQNSFKSQVKEIEQEVRKRDMLIEVLQTRIQELQRGDSVDTVLLSPPQTSFRNQEYLSHIEQRFQPKIMLENRRSWEDRSEEENLEVRELPSSITPRPMWKDDISIDIASDDASTSASETDELFAHLDDDLHLTKHDQNWEVRMLARELEKREHKESQSNKLKSESGVQKTQLLNVRSLEERCTFNVTTPSQRSISSDNIYTSSASYYSAVDEPIFTHSASYQTTTTSVSPDVVPVPIVTTSGVSSQSSTGS
ncbi:uncharacterized protein LOC135832373 isoform X3 [Planococcus citri]|uniref:uncharacterized protein LOC135832373 isoform X3 n=1 Tax=Planococcus citri TaxID=170843 RepID=UPI0031F9A354